MMILAFRYGLLLSFCQDVNNTPKMNIVISRVITRDVPVSVFSDVSSLSNK